VEHSKCSNLARLIICNNHIYRVKFKIREWVNKVYSCNSRNKKREEQELKFKQVRRATLDSDLKARGKSQSNLHREFKL
jgi:hypothetical protein